MDDVSATIASQSVESSNEVHSPKIFLSRSSSLDLLEEPVKSKLLVIGC